MELLGKALVTYFRELTDTFNQHPLDSKNTTIASYSFAAVQKVLCSQKRVACFSPTNTSLYGALRESCIGGLCCVFKHKADKFTMPSLYRDHADENCTPREPTEADGEGSVLYLDANSLYGSCVSFSHSRAF